MPTLRLRQPKATMSYSEDVKAYIDGVLSGRIVTGRLELHSG